MTKPPRRNIFLLLSKSENRGAINDIIDDAALSEQEKGAALRPLMSEIAFFEYRQWRSASAALKEKLPFLKNIENEAEESIILEIVHDKTVSEHRKEQLLKKLLSEAAFEEYLRWKPSNIVLTPDSFMRLLDEEIRPIAQRRLNSKDFEALDIFIRAVGGDALEVYEKWKGQLKRQGKALIPQNPALPSTDPPTLVKVEATPGLLAITEGETVQSYSEMLEKLTHMREEMKENIQWNREQTALVELCGGQVQTGPTLEQISLVTHLQGAHMAAASLAQLAEAVWRQKPGEAFEFSVEHKTTGSVKEEPSEPSTEELRKQFRLDALNTSLANERLLALENVD